MLIVHRLVLTALVAVAVCSCDLGKDTASTAEGGAEGAVGIADKMSEGTVGAADDDGEGE